MRVIITKNAEKFNNFSDFITIPSISDLEVLIGDIESIVIVNPTEEGEKAIHSLSKLTKIRDCSLYYIPMGYSNQTLEIFIRGLPGVIIHDEFYLTDNDTLKELLNKETNLAVLDLPGVNVIDDFLLKLQGNDKSVASPAYLNVVTSALDRMQSEYLVKQEKILEISEKFTEIFKNNLQLNEDKDLALANIQKIVDNLENQLVGSKGVFNSQHSQREMGTSATKLYSYPEVSPKIDKKMVLLIKDLGRTNYLTSFILGLLYYASNVRYISTKVMFIEPPRDIYKKMYEKSYTFISQDTKLSSDMLSNSVVFCNAPYLSTFDEFLSDKSVRLFIIVDRANMSEKHLVQGKDVIYASNGENIANALGIKLNRVLLSKGSSSKDIFGSFGGHNLNYPTDVGARESFYAKVHEEVYKKLLDEVIR